MKNLTLTICILCFAACTTIQDQMNSWMGASKQQLYMSWGPPARITEDGNGGEILVYAKQVYLPGGSSTFYSDNGTASTSYRNSINYWDYKFMYANSSGIIYYWMIRKEQIPPQEINLNVYRKY